MIFNPRKWQQGWNAIHHIQTHTTNRCCKLNNKCSTQSRTKYNTFNRFVCYGKTINLVDISIQMCPIKSVWCAKLGAEWNVAGWGTLNHNKSSASVIVSGSDWQSGEENQCGSFIKHHQAAQEYLNLTTGSIAELIAAPSHSALCSQHGKHTSSAHHVPHVFSKLPSYKFKRNYTIPWCY